MPKVLWTIRTTQTLTPELWARFVEKARAAGHSPARVLESFILNYAMRPDHDTPPKEPRP